MQKCVNGASKNMGEGCMQLDKRLLVESNLRKISKERKPRSIASFNVILSALQLTTIEVTRAYKNRHAREFYTRNH